MQRRSRYVVRAILPLIPLGFCNGCGGGGDGASAPSASANPPAAAAPAPAPVVVNAPPTISASTLDDAQVGASFDYQPVASDPEGDALQFSAANLPAWASLDPTSGRISGIPAATDVGVYESVRITVADATHQVAGDAFSITVLQPPDSGTGVATVQWAAPALKVNGSPLDDLAGYRVLYGRDSADLDQSVIITDPTLTSYQFSTLPAGTWYFAVVAVNACGLEGPATALASKTI